MVNNQLHGRVVIVTGSNAGMGKEISLGLAGLGATLVMVSRDRERGEAARADVNDMRQMLMKIDLVIIDPRGPRAKLPVLRICRSVLQSNDSPGDELE